MFILIIDGILLGMAELAAGLVKPFYYNRVAAQEKLADAKAPGEKRVFVFGESTIYGVPYGPNNSTACWLQALLKELLPGENIRVINFGGPGQGSYHLLDALQKTVAYEPDAIVMCVGHNEFLAGPLSLATSGAAHRWWYFHCHLYRIGFHALPSLHERMGQSGNSYVGIPSWSEKHAEVLSHYRSNVDAMLTLADENHIPMIVAMPGCYGPWPPNQSQHYQPMPEDKQRDFAEQVKAVRQAVRRGQGDEATIRQLLKESDHYAELHYCLARVLERMGRHAEAYEEFYKALDLDCVPLRGQSAHIAILREVSERRHAPFINMRDVFKEHGPDCTPGGNLFVDHCHPRPHGQYLMAEAMARSLCAQGRLAPSDHWQWDRLPTFETCVKQIRLTPEEWRAAERTVIISVFLSAPEVVADMSAVRPPFAAAADPEWRAMHLLALWQCGREEEAAEAWTKLTAAERSAVAGSIHSWPQPLQDSWAKTVAAMSSRLNWAAR
jgi:lysophospholipase L1-like esterase